MEKHSGKKNTPQSYLLNIYPRPGSGNTVLGTVERLGNDGRHTFHDVQELLDLLGIENTEQEEQHHV